MEEPPGANWGCTRTLWHVACRCWESNHWPSDWWPTMGCKCHIFQPDYNDDHKNSSVLTILSHYLLLLRLFIQNANYSLNIGQNSYIPKNTVWELLSWQHHGMAVSNRKSARLDNLSISPFFFSQNYSCHFLCVQPSATLCLPLRRDCAIVRAIIPICTIYWVIPNRYINGFDFRHGQLTCHAP